MPRIPDFSQRRCESVQQDAQYIPPEVWELHKEEIRDLYVGTTKPLDELMRYMQVAHSFEATKKQWKDQLSRWPLKRYLNKSDAAHCLRLHREADPGCGRRVCFFGKEKTLLDLLSYIRKSTTVNSEHDLLREIGRKEPTPTYITFDDIPPASTQIVPITVTTTIGSRFSQSDHSSRMGVEGSTPSRNVLPNSSRTSFTNYESSPPWQLLDLSECATREASPVPQLNDAIQDDGFDMEYEYDFTLPESLMQPTQMTSGSLGSVTLNQDLLGPQNAWSVAQPFMSPESSPATTPASDYFHSLVSATPPQRLANVTADQLSWELCGVLYKVLNTQDAYAQLDVVPAKNASTTGFFMHAIYACILRNQQLSTQAHEEFGIAALEFEKIIEHQLDNSLTVISGLIALLESYGHRMGAREILGRVRDIFLRDIKVRSPFAETLSFMCQTQIPEYGSQGTYDIGSLLWIRAEFQRLYGSHSRLTLTAQFNLAWALLERKDYSNARSLLMELKPLCETVFGPYHVQTIMASATLARAHLYNGEHTSAEMTIKESVISRIEKTFSTSHPYYWEAKFRQGVFMKMRSAKEQDPRVQRSLMQQSEELLREVLIWRTIILGTANPRTHSTFRVLKSLLEAQGRSGEANLLHDWAVKECQPRRQELFEKDFACT